MDKAVIRGSPDIDMRPCSMTPNPFVAVVQLIILIHDTIHVEGTPSFNIF